LEDSFYYTFGYLVFDVLTRMELKWADHYIVCGKSGLADYLSFGKIDSARTTLIQNGIDLEKIDSILKQEKGANKNQAEQRSFTLFTCGRLYATKGTEYLIRAMPHVLSEYRDVRLKIFGKGPMKARLETLINSLRLEENVTLEGHVSYSRLIREMHQSDLTVFPSMVEVGASIAIMEAMACRKPVIAFEYPFNKGLIEHSKTGYLVPKRNVHQLARAICILLQDDNLRKKIGENAFNYILRNHDYRKIVKKYIEVYSDLISNRCN
jgi:glycosyltransferase involved in cell wall biosynthesis